MAVRAALPAQPRRRRAALHGRGLARGHRRQPVAARHACRPARQAAARPRPDRRDATHRRSTDPGQCAEERRRRLGGAAGRARAAGGDHARAGRRHRCAGGHAGRRARGLRAAGRTRPRPAHLRRAGVCRAQPQQHRGRSQAPGHRRHRAGQRFAVAGVRVAARAGRGAAAGGQRRAGRHRGRQCGLWQRAWHDAGLRHDADRRSGRLRDLLPRASAGRRRSGRLAALATQQLADGAARLADLGVRLFSAGAVGLSRAGAARRVFVGGPRRRGARHPLRAADPDAARHAWRRLAAAARPCHRRRAARHAAVALAPGGAGCGRGIAAVATQRSVACRPRLAEPDCQGGAGAGRQPARRPERG